MIYVITYSTVADMRRGNFRGSYRNNRGSSHRGDSGRGANRGPYTRDSAPPCNISIPYQRDLVKAPIDVKESDIQMCDSTGAGANARAGSAVSADAIAIEFDPPKKRLDEAKDAIGAFTDATTKTNEWLRYRKSTDIYAGLRNYFVNEIGEKHVTNAYLKYHEIASTFFPSHLPAKDVILFANAELPGAAIASLNHWFVQHNISFDWYASSLVPADMERGGDGSIDSNNTALGDTYGFFVKNREKWLMNSKNNGDMTVAANILDVAARIGPKSPVGGCHVYSHDAGIDVSGSDEQFNDQESANARLHFGCAVAGMMTMRPGAVFIAKQYSFYETFTWHAILIYASLFESFYLCKPLTSRPTNSETYLIGIGFKGISDGLAKTLLDRLENWSMNPLLKNARILDAVSMLKRFHRIVYKQQINVLEAALPAYKSCSPQSIEAAMAQLKRDRTTAWLNSNPARRIPQEKQVPSK